VRTGVTRKRVKLRVIYFAARARATVSDGQAQPACSYYLINMSNQNSRLGESIDPAPPGTTPESADALVKSKLAEAQAKAEAALAAEQAAAAHKKA